MAVGFMTAATITSENNLDLSTKCAPTCEINDGAPIAFTWRVASRYKSFQPATETDSVAFKLTNDAGVARYLCLNCRPERYRRRN